MSDKDFIAAIGALLGPGVIALVQRPTWAPRHRMIVAFLIMLLWTLFVFFFLGGEPPALSDWRAWARLIFINIVGVATSHQWIFKPLGAAAWIEARTSPTGNATERAAVRALDDEAERTATPPRLPEK